MQLAIKLHRSRGSCYSLVWICLINMMEQKFEKTSLKSCFYSLFSLPFKNGLNIKLQDMMEFNSQVLETQRSLLLTPWSQNWGVINLIKEGSPNMLQLSRILHRKTLEIRSWTVPAQDIMTSSDCLAPLDHSTSSHSQGSSPLSSAANLLVVEGKKPTVANCNHDRFHEMIQSITLPKYFMEGLA